MEELFLAQRRKGAKTQSAAAFSEVFFASLRLCARNILATDAPWVFCAKQRREQNISREQRQVNRRLSSTQETIYDSSRRASVGSEPEFEPAIDDASFGVRVNLTEGRQLVWRENYLAKAALAGVGDVFEIDKETELAKRFFAEDP